MEQNHKYLRICLKPNFDSEFDANIIEISLREGKQDIHLKEEEETDVCE